MKTKKKDGRTLLLPERPAGESQAERPATKTRRNGKPKNGQPPKGKEKKDIAKPRKTREPAAISFRQHWPKIAAIAAVFAGVFAWSYWPTLVEMVEVWEREPDYSHGFLVAPLAIFLLWMRRDLAPTWTGKIAWPGLALIVLSIGIRALGGWAYFDALDGWSIPIWIAGVVWLFGGWKIFAWAAPAIAFLWFMVPLPFRIEQSLSYPLQRIATKMSSFALQCLGQPALSEGNTILLGDTQLEVEQACSGMRIFLGIAALAFAYIIVVRRSWWERALLLLAALPIALVANSARIVVTGLLYQLVSGEAAQHFSHDLAGWVMIPFAALLFALVLGYLRWVVRDVTVVDAGTLLRSDEA
jgi:exosortase